MERKAESLDFSSQVNPLHLLLFDNFDVFSDTDRGFLEKSVVI